MAAIKPASISALLAAAAIALAALLPYAAWSDEPSETDLPSQTSQNASEEATQGDPRSGTQVTVVKQGDSEPVVMEERKEPLADTGDETAAATVAAAALASLGAAVVAMKKPRGGTQP